MNCSIADLCEKEIINLKDGMRLGCVNEVEIDTCSGRLISIIIYTHSRLLNLGNKQEDFKICWEQIEVIGDDTILVNIDCPPSFKPKQKGGLLSTVFREG